MLPSCLELRLPGLTRIFVQGTLVATKIGSTTTGYLLIPDCVLDAHLDEGYTDNDLDGTIVLHDDFDRMAGFQA